jgi:ATP diphosphatase
MARLRDPDSGCPWDLEQRFDTIVPHTLEEAYEVADAIERGDFSELHGELGDLLFQVVFYARLAEEQGLFDFNDVVAGISDKLIRRHPHVFADAVVEDAAAQTQAWEAHKAEERARRPHHTGTLSGIAAALPALSRAAKLQKRAARVGFDWSDIQPIFAKVEEELEEVREEVCREAEHAADPAQQARLEEEIGDLLFACTNLARYAHIDPEAALRRANHKFERRFAAMEAAAEAQQQALNELSLDEWDALWEGVKAEEKSV